MTDRCERTTLGLSIVLLLLAAIAWPHWSTWPLAVTGVLTLWLGWCLAHAPVME